MLPVLLLITISVLFSSVKIHAATWVPESERYPRNCKETALSKPDIHLIQLDYYVTNPFWVACEREYDGGGWIVIQRRQSGQVDFYRGWHDYKYGFGDLNGEFWIGLEKLYALTASSRQELLVVLKDFKGETRTARYDFFAIGDENEGYALKILGSYSGTAGDSLNHQKSQKFTTKDKNNALIGENCAVHHTGAWWYANLDEYCFKSNLNGQYFKNNEEINWKGVSWGTFRDWESLQFTQMMIRPKQ